MNKFKSFVFGALFAVASVHTAFAAISQEDFDAIKKIAPEEYSDVFEALQLDQVNALMDADEVFKVSIEQLVELTKQPKEPTYEPVYADTSDGLNPNEPFTFDKAYEVYSAKLDSTHYHYVAGYIQIDKLQAAATTPEQKEKFKAFKKTYDDIMSFALEKNAPDFAAKIRRLVNHCYASDANKNSVPLIINEAIDAYHAHVIGKMKGKAAKADLDEYYEYLITYLKKNRFKYDGIKGITHTPEGKPLDDNFSASAHEIIRKDMGDILGKIGRVTNSGELYRDEMYIGKLSNAGYIYNANGKEVGQVKNNKIYIKGKAVGEIKHPGKCYINGRYVGSFGQSTFSFSNDKSIPLKTFTDKFHDAFVLFFYQVIPQ